MEQTQHIILQCRKSELALHERTHVMGVLNVTPDSFSDGGEYLKHSDAVTRALQMAEEGADIIDVGGESSRPGAKPVSTEEEIDRTRPVIKGIREHSDIPVSIDTTKATVAEAALEAGADIINDISALRFDADMAALAASFAVPIVLMHMQGTPETMQLNPHYSSLIDDIKRDLMACIESALKAGISSKNIIIDPGIGFGKRKEDNFQILNRLNKFQTLNYPLLVGVSRKSFIGWALDKPERERLMGTAAAVAASIIGGAHIIRVHEVKEMVQIARIIDLIKADGRSELFPLHQ